MDDTSRDEADHTKQGLGHYGETLAARHLTGAGMVLLERNWRTTAGEIDLLLREGDVLVVCEVKTRTSDACGLPHEAVDQAKVDRLRRKRRQARRQHATGGNPDREGPQRLHGTEYTPHGRSPFARSGDRMDRSWARPGVA